MQLKSLIPALCLLPLSAMAQSEIYPGHFDLQEVQLKASPLRTAMTTNAELLLRYDADRLMTPFIREAKLDKVAGGKYAGWVVAHPSFRNWGDYSWSLEGHIGGHYLSALAMAYAAMKSDPACADLTKRTKARLDYCLGIMADCQSAYASSTDGMRGFIGGQPYTEIWRGLYAGDLAPFRKHGGKVPFYCQHKVLAGLRDAYLYAGSQKAKAMYRGLCDWSVDVVAKLSTADMQSVLGWEHGGMNEMLADAYKIFGDKRYLDAAKKYSHQTMIDGMQKPDPSFLNGKHANTQVPKYIGFERIAQLDPTATTFKTAAYNFWADVAANRTVCIGGNSVNEHFLGQNNYDRYISQLDGPESCNTNNMLKLSEDLADDTHDARYADFYENAMYNHILATQDPKTGGYVYFTTLRPQGFKIYSQVDQGMWCCVGTGMENHSKYGCFVYTHTADTLFVNLFTASKLSSKRFALEQTTDFPYSDRTTITVAKPGRYSIALRHPKWAADGYAISINGKKQTISVEKGIASYATITRTWRKGDRIEVSLPMELRIEECPGLKEYIAIKYGPVLLAAPVGNDNMHEYGDDSRMGHAPSCVSKAKSILSSPMLICPRADVLRGITKTGPLAFKLDVAGKSYELHPFFATHHTRYMIYWYQQTAEEYAKSDLAAEEAEALALAKRTADFVAPGEQQSEAGHKAAFSDGTKHGSYKGETYRHAQAGGYLQYTLEADAPATAIMLRMQVNDAGRHCAIYADGKLLEHYTVPDAVSPQRNGFYNYTIALPQPAKATTIKIVSEGGTPTPGLFCIRLIK